MTTKRPIIVIDGKAIRWKELTLESEPPHWSIFDEYVPSYKSRHWISVTGYDGKRHAYQIHEQAYILRRSGREMLIVKTAKNSDMPPNAL